MKDMLIGRIEQLTGSPSAAVLVVPGVDDAALVDLSEVGRLKGRIRELEALINTPHTANFLEAVRLEAAHQRERWAADHDAGKTDADWYWLVGHLAGKAVYKPEKQLHHIITTAAALLNWHMARTVGTDMRPGIAEPTGFQSDSTERK